MKLEDKIANWVEDTLNAETDGEDEHYDCDTTTRYFKGNGKTRIVVTSRIILYVCGGVEQLITSIALDHPDKEIVQEVIADAVDCLRDIAHGSASLREVEDILELLDEDDDEE